MPVVKEPAYFNEDLPFHLRIYKTEDDYLKLFAPAQPQQKILGEASVSYISSKTAPEHIHRFNPEAKIIVMLRDLADTLYSFHNEMSFRGRTQATFEDSLGVEVSQKLDYYALARSWPDQIRRYQELFGAENVMIIIFDDFKDKTPQVFEDVCKFLNIAPGFQPEFKIHNPSGKPKLLWLSRLLSSPPSQAVGRFVFTRIPFGNYLDLFQFNRKTTRLPKLPEHLRQKIIRDLMPVYHEFEALTSRDLSQWYQEVLETAE